VCASSAVVVGGRSAYLSKRGPRNVIRTVGPIRKASDSVRAFGDGKRANQQRRPAAAIDIPGSMAELARRIGVRLGSVQKYPALNRVPAEQVIPIERATGGKVTRYMLGPDLCPDQP